VNPFLVVDGHLDIAHNALVLGRDFWRHAIETRAQEPEAPRGGVCTSSLPDLLAGNVRVVFGTLYAAPAEFTTSHNKVYRTAEEAQALADDQIAFYALLAADPRVSLITTRDDLERVVASPEPRLGIVLLMEGADPIVHPSDAPRWFEAGVRIIGPAWSQTRYAGGTGRPGPLSELGRELLDVMAQTGFILDVSHLAVESFFQALEIFPGTVIASHSNVHSLVPTDRQLTDEMIKALVARDAVIGLVFYNQFLQDGWRQAGALKEAVAFARVIDHVKHIADLAGDVKHIGIGSDLDGGFGREAAPSELDTVADLCKFGDALAAAGFGDGDIRAILGENWLRLLRRGLPP
jgi:membrane dipeptidase